MSEKQDIIAVPRELAERWINSWGDAKTEARNELYLMLMVQVRPDLHEVIDVMLKASDTGTGTQAAAGRALLNLHGYINTEEA